MLLSLATFCLVSGSSILLFSTHFMSMNLTLTEVIAAELMSVTDNWGITEKVVCVVTDNANNIVAAVRLNSWKHLPCFAHTLNLDVQDSLKADPELAEIQKKYQALCRIFIIAANPLTSLLPPKPA